MQRQIRLLLDRFYGHESHVRPRNRLADRLRIIAVVLPALAIRSHKFRCHQFHAVTKSGEASMPLRHGGSCTMSCANFARDTLRRIKTTPSASTPWTENTFFAKSIPTIDTMLMGLPLLKRLMSQTNPGTPVPPRDGEVPYIR